MTANVAQQTAKSILLIPYSTARSRLVKDITDVTLSKKDIEMQEMDQPDTETGATQQRRKRLPKSKKSGSRRDRRLAKKKERARKRKTKERPEVDPDDFLPSEETTDDSDSDEYIDSNAPKGDGGVRRRRLELIYPKFQAFWVICDEAHHVKNSNSRTSLVVSAIPQEFILLVTATPLLNSVRDIGGYLTLMWRQE